MARPLILTVLAVGGILAAAPSSAEDDPVAGIRQTMAAQRQIPQIPSGADALTSASFASERQAAIGFVDIVRKLPVQRNEYCAYILRGTDKQFFFSPLRTGDFNHCPADIAVNPWPKPANAVASVHTHPLGGRDSDPSVAGQVFSEGDFAFAESSEENIPIYLGAPAGHVLRYAPGNTFCKGQSFVRRNFDVVRDIRPSVVGQLPINPGVDVPLYDQMGQKQPKPQYCKSL